MAPIDFTTYDWSTISKEVHRGLLGHATWQSITFPGLRIRIVEYSINYKADHWCKKGHIVYCLEGEVINHLQNGEHYILKAGMSYVVSDDASSHRSTTMVGAKLLIIDGEFLNR